MDITLDLTEEAGIILSPGDTVRIGRMSEIEWTVNYGWYTYGGNRPQCGWFLKNKCIPNMIKPLHLTDVYDIYMLG